VPNVVLDEERARLGHPAPRVSVRGIAVTGAEQSLEDLKGPEAPRTWGARQMGRIFAAIARLGRLSGPVARGIGFALLPDERPHSPRETPVFDATTISTTVLPDFRVGACLVQPSLNRIERDGTVVKLRPQLMTLLVCLASRGGRTALRHEIFDEVWPDQHVVPSSLARCIAELRQALGDVAHAESRYIETIAKRGYRLLLPVELVEDQHASVSVGRAPVSDSLAGGGLLAAPAVDPSPRHPGLLRLARRLVLAATHAGVAWLARDGVRGGI
jgi:DNA-binding winged helix-turn-helix (wHTH) protein